LFKYIAERPLTAWSVSRGVLSAEGSGGDNTTNTTSADGDSGRECTLRLTCDIAVQIAKYCRCVGNSTSITEKDTGVSNRVVRVEGGL